MSGDLERGKRAKRKPAARRPGRPPRRPAWRRERGRPEPLRLIPFVHRATHRVGLWLDTHLPAGGTQAECHILAHLAASGGATVGELHRALEHRRSTLTSVLDRLEARGIVRRTSAPNDRRSFLIELTPAGEAVAARVHAGLAELEHRALQSMPPADLARCIEILDRIG